MKSNCCEYVRLNEQVDRLTSELQLSPLEAWQHLQRLVENVNALTATLVRGLEQPHPRIPCGSFHFPSHLFTLTFISRLFFILSLYTVLAPRAQHLLS